MNKKNKIRRNKSSHTGIRERLREAALSTHRHRLRQELLQRLVLRHQVLLDLDVLGHGGLQEGALDILLVHEDLVGRHVGGLRRLLLLLEAWDVHACGGKGRGLG